MSTCFLILWTPIFAKIFIEIITRQPVGAIFDAFCATGVITHSAVSPVIMYFMDHRIRQSVRQVYFTKK
jgi:hypothetical protein